MSSALAVGSPPVSHHNSAKSAEKKVATKKSPSFLFVVSAKKGEIKRGKDGKHLLIIQNADMDKVIMFSDRPYRYVKEISGAELLTIWPEGKDSFKKDPPNAVLSGANMKPVIVILSSFTVAKDQLTFELIGDSDIKRVINGSYDVNRPVLTTDGSAPAFPPPIGS